MFIFFMLFFPAAYTGIPDQQPYRSSNQILSRPLVRNDGRVYTCSERSLFAFQSNGSIAWTQRLRYSCNSDIGPIDGGRNNIYVVSGAKVLDVNLLKAAKSESATEIFFDAMPDAIDDPVKIVGLVASVSLSNVFINVNPNGLFAFSMSKQFLWSMGPVLRQFVYRQGCKNNNSDCHFDSVPVLDHCEASLYISNNQGELYSISATNPSFNWVLDLSSYGRSFTTTPGNNGLLYIMFSAKSLLLAVDVFTGASQWEQSIGPVSPHTSPIVDSSGWVSIGSLDGTLYSFASTGISKKFPKSDTLDYIIQINPVIHCSGFAVYLDQTIVEKKNHTTRDYDYISALKAKAARLTLLEPATGFIHWSETYPGGSLEFMSSHDVSRFLLDERTIIAFVVSSNIGSPLPCRNEEEKLVSTCSQAKHKTLGIYTRNEKGIMMFLVVESVLLVLLAVLVQFCCIFWRKKKLQSRRLGSFLEKRHSLQLEKKMINKILTDLEQKASGGATTSGVVEEISNLARERERIKGKLSTSYSLGRDTVSRSKPKMKKFLLPSYNKKSRENGSAFHPLSDTSESTHSSSSWTDDSRIFSKEDNDADSEEYIENKSEA